MLTRLQRWIDERWPLSYLVRLGLEEDIPGGSSYAYVFGSMLLFTFAIQVATGIWQLFYYVPSVMYAYDSLSYLRTKVPFGWLIHGFHYWGANAMIILLLCHVVRVFTWGAYKRRRELNWLSGVILLLLTLGMSFTGAPLPWDEKGYWAAEVGTSIANTVPYVGDAVKRIINGGEVMGQLSLSRMFIVHAAIIPGAIMALILIHLVAFRKFGGIGPWSEARRLRSGVFWPDQAWKDMLAFSLLFMALLVIIVFSPPPFMGPADPLDTSYTPKPEWNFLFLYQALKFFPGKLEPLGTMGIPLIAVLILVAIPFLDRRDETNPLRRPVAMSALAVAIVALVALTLAGFYSQPGVQRESTAPPPAAPAGVAKGGGQPGAGLFQSLGCVGCHRIDGKGGNVGPDLSGEGKKGRSREWLATQIHNPRAHDPASIMPAFSSLSGQQTEQLVDYLESLKVEAAPAVSKPTTVEQTVASRIASVFQVPGEAAYTIGNARHGETLFERNCASCHGSHGSDRVPNPGSETGYVPALAPIDLALYDKDPERFADKIDMFIQYGSAAPPPALTMPAFGQSQALTQQEISNLEAYILRINGVDRGKVLNPGVEPPVFLVASAAIYVCMCIVALWWTRRRQL